MKKVFVFIVIMLLASISLALPQNHASPKKVANSDIEVVPDLIDRMKDDVLNQKSQMLLFRQLIVSENVEAMFPTVTIHHLNEMGSRYKIVSLVYTLDGETVYSYYGDQRDKKALGRKVQVFKGPLVPGTHKLMVDVVYKGNDTGVFSYINDYKIPVHRERKLKVTKGRKLKVQVVGYEKGWALTDFKDRPVIKFKISGSKSSKGLK